MDPEFELEGQNSKEKLKNWLGCFEINSMFLIWVHGFFLGLSRVLTWFELSRVELYRNDLKENKNYFALAEAKVWVNEGSSYQG